MVNTKDVVLLPIAWFILAMFTLFVYFALGLISPHIGVLYPVDIGTNPSVSLTGFMLPLILIIGFFIYDLRGGGKNKRPYKLLLSGALVSIIVSLLAPSLFIGSNGSNTSLSYVFIYATIPFSLIYLLKQDKSLLRYFVIAGLLLGFLSFVTGDIGTIVYNCILHIGSGCGLGPNGIGDGDFLATIAIAVEAAIVFATNKYTPIFRWLI